jgi:hypothetical protein
MPHGLNRLARAAPERRPGLYAGVPRGRHRPARFAEPHDSESCLAQFSQNMRIKIGPDPESRILNQFVEHRLDPIDQSRSFGLCQDTGETGSSHTQAGGDPASTSFVYQEEIRLTLDGEHN